MAATVVGYQPTKPTIPPSTVNREYKIKNASPNLYGRAHPPDSLFSIRIEGGSDKVGQAGPCSGYNLQI